MKHCELRISILGAFAFKTMDTGGQPVKTRELYYALSERFGHDRVKCLDTYGWKKRPVSFFIEVIKTLLWSNRCIMLPAQNGLGLFSHLLCSFKRKNRSIFYDVIGGWLVDSVKKNKGLRKRLLKFDGIWVETNTMKTRLEQIGFSNISILRNFKDLPIVDCVRENDNIPFKACLFSRVMKEKGIGDAINTIARINKEQNKIIYYLDVYGPIAPQYSEEFESLLSLHKDCVSYKGIVDPCVSVSVLCNYFVLLFPTLFYTEGIPGTIIDSYSAGVPVIASRWESWSDVIIDDKTGISFEFGNIEGLYGVLQRAWKNPQLLFKMKRNCLEEAHKYTRKAAVDLLVDLMGI